jgi:hypothetical protein
MTRLSALAFAVFCVLTATCSTGNSPTATRCCIAEGFGDRRRIPSARLLWAGRLVARPLSSADARSLLERTAAYVRRTMHEFFSGMRIPEKRRPHVIRTIRYCAELQGLVLKDKSRSGLTFLSTERLSEFWGDMYGEVRKAV